MKSTLSMDVMLNNREGVQWKRAEFKGSNTSSLNPEDAKYEALVPKNTDRFVYLSQPSSVGKRAAYFTSIINYIWEDERKATIENYNKIQEDERRLAEARTAAGNAAKAKGSTKNFSEEDVVFYRKAVIPFNSKNMSSFGQVLPNKRTKDVWLAVPVPQQADTFMGYNYETTDGKLRALIYNNMIIFVDAQYDKSLRAKLDKLYEKQEERRQKEAKTSLSNF